MDYERIEQEARRLQREIYARRHLLFSTPPPPHLMFRPDIAARVLGLVYRYRDFISAEDGSPDMQAAGLLDRQTGEICVSTNFSHEEQRFTGGHECGHAQLHDWAGERVAHRDRPMSKQVDNPGLPLPEREANYFSACFLAPRKLVIDAFKRRFGEPPLVLDHTLAYHLRLDPVSERKLLTSGPGSMDLAIALSRFANRDFPALAQHFQMSVTAMAVRLRELGLVRL
jgi:IrrE N-terminal-like domain